MWRLPVIAESQRPAPSSDTAALGLVTAWGGTQRLPRLIGKSRALELFITAEKIFAKRALEIGLVDAIADDPVAEALRSTATGIVNS